MKFFWKLHRKPKTVSELIVALEKIWEFSTVSINKAVPSFRKRLTECVKDLAFTITQKWSHIVFVLS